MTNVFGQQTEKPSSKTIADQFEKYYNKDDYDGIFNMFSAEMQKALPINKTKDFLSGLKAQSGKIVQRDFIRYQNSFASYKTKFENTLYNLSIAVDDQSKIGGFFVRPYTDDNLPVITRNKTKLILPFKDAWTVTWGGDTKELNYHVESIAQKNAFDFIITNSSGKSYKTDGKSNEDYYAFGKELFAPCDGEIVLAVDGVKDNKPGNENPIYVTGNSVILKTANQEYILFAHFKQHSVAVKEGQKVKQGQLLGLCGNSGNSSEPHLHFHIQNVEDMNVATGVKCYFDKLVVNGQPKTDYSPIKRDIIKND